VTSRPKGPIAHNELPQLNAARIPGTSTTQPDPSSQKLSIEIAGLIGSPVVPDAVRRRLPSGPGVDHRAIAGFPRPSAIIMAGRTNSQA